MILFNLNKIQNIKNKKPCLTGMFGFVELIVLYCF